MRGWSLLYAERPLAAKRCQQVHFVAVQLRVSSMFSGSIVALITPFQANASVDYDALARIVDLHAASGTQGIVVGGTTGESATLTTEEHAQLIERSVRLADGRMQVIAGTGSNSTAQTLNLSRAAEIDGVDGLLLVVPYYNKPPQRGMVAHFTAIADTVDKPIMLYNVPGRTVADLSPESVAELAQHERIVAIKDATGDLDRLAAQQVVCPDDFKFLSGDDFTSCEFMLRGGHGVVSVTANVAPALMAELCTLARAGDRKQARVIDARLAALNEAMFLESNPIPVKWAMQHLGYGDGSIRPPLARLHKRHQDAVITSLKNADLI
ncbi:MAG: 4-hydroxy-tetrahydrodipicolinate synthase [Pseudomonadota bacterium]